MESPKNVPNVNMDRSRVRETGTKQPCDVAMCLPLESWI